METAVNLYQTGKVEKVLISGDNSYLDYNEPGAMMAFALELGMPEEDIVLDYAGRRTYDTCYRARDISAKVTAFWLHRNSTYPGPYTPVTH